MTLSLVDSWESSESGPIMDELEARFFQLMTELGESGLSEPQLRTLFLTFTQGLIDHEIKLVPTAQSSSVQVHTVCRGALREGFSREFAAVMANLADPDTKPKAKRAVTLKLEIESNEDRDIAKLKASVTPTLAPKKPVTSNLFVNIDSPESSQEQASRYEQKSFV